MIEKAVARAAGTTDHDASISGCALAMEGVWIGLHPMDDAVERYSGLRDSAELAGNSSGRAMLAFWARCLGLDPPPGRIPDPADLEWNGEIQEAAE